MHWLLLIIAAIFEIGWPLGFKLSSTQPERFWTWITFAIVSMALSGVFLYFAQRTIPVSTAYIIWTGLGAIGTLLIGILFFGDSASVLRLFFALLTLVGIVGLELISACSSNNKTHTILGSEHIDSVTQKKTPASSETTDAQTPSIFDELANNMVCVEVDTGNFYICKYEVTQKLWSEVMGDNPSQMQGDDLPVEQVNWNDCQRFIAKLNELTGKNYRLPTEAEWEYACRGGKHSKGFKYSGSDEIDKVAWYDGNSESKSHPVGQKKPNELGLYDMSGNVWEWCQDMHEGTGMCRGGSWIHNARNCDPSLPNETPQSFSIDCLGLRLAL